MGSLCLYRQQRGLHIFFRSAGLQLTLVLLFCSVALSRDLYAQEPLDRKVTISLKSVTLEKALTELENAAHVKFVYSRSRVKVNVLVTVDATDKKLSDILKELLEPRGIDFSSSTGKEQILLYLHADGPPKTGELNEPVPDNPQRPSQGFRADIAGTVLDAATQQPLPGVNVIVRGTTNGTSTNAEGKYSITATDNDILVFSFIGYKPFETRIAGRILIDVNLDSDVTALKEVVINAGYYDVKDKEKTSSISKVTSDVIEKQPVTNPLGALQGRMPGVYIQQTSGVPGSEFNIQIRGRNSLRGDANQPLYIIDGVPFSTEKTFSSFATGNFGNTLGVDSYGTSKVSPLTSINPSDIESIEILKDADATAIYGSRGANGVVLITTKKGKAGKTSFDLNIYTGVGKARKLALLSTKQFLDLRREAYKNDELIPSSTIGDPGYSPELMIWDTTRYTDWQKVLMGGLAQTTSVQSSVSGGSDRTQFLFSLGYRKENSVYPGNLGYQKGSFHLSVNHKSGNDKFFITTSLTGSKDKNNQQVNSFNSSARRLAPNAPALRDANGNLNWENSTWINPLSDAEVSYNNNVINFTGNGVIGYEILRGLTVKSSFGISLLESNERAKYPHTRYDPSYGYTSAKSFVQAAAGSNQTWSVEPQITWARKISKGQLTALGGFTFQEQLLERKSDHYEGFASNALLDNLGAAAITSNYEFVQSTYRYAAVFGRVNYTWDEKYILNLTGRRDGSSRFGPGKQFALFGAVGAAWLFSHEDFLKDNTILSFGKIRSSYGSTGSDQIGNYQYLDTYSSNTSTTFRDQYQGVSWISPTRLYNPDYAWEVNKKFEVGLELGFLRDRLYAELNYYRNRSSNQLVNYTLPKTTGFTGILSNLQATVQNTGVELELTTINLQTSIQWTTSLNITFPRNKLVEFPNLESSSYANSYVIGQPLTINKVYESSGVNPETGVWIFKDINGDGIISSPEDNTKVVFVGQKFFGGLSNALAFKGWTLDFLFQFVKQTGFEAWRSGFVMLGSDYNVPEFMLDKKRWRKPGDVADLQRLYVNNAEAEIARRNYIGSDATIGDASFIRLKNVSLSYTLPKTFTKSISCRIYFQGQNLFLITRYQGDDPENQFFDSLAPLRMFTLGAQITL